jgi:hypothetical protein
MGFERGSELIVCAVVQFLHQHELFLHICDKWTDASIISAFWRPVEDIVLTNAKDYLFSPAVSWLPDTSTTMPMRQFA